MSAANPVSAPKAAYTPEVAHVQVPEWEHIAAAEQGHQEKPNNAAHARNAKNTLRNAGALAATKFDRLMPPHKRYLRLRRKTFLLLLGGVLALLILIIGLAAGLSSKKSAAQKATKNLPLPSNTATFSGDLTYYDPGLGACGETDTSSDAIVAVSHLLFDAAGSSTSTGGNSNMNPLCGMMLRAQRYDADAGAMRSVDLKVVDRCTGCQAEDLDTTEGVFTQLSDVGRGRVDVTWAWLE